MVMISGSSVSNVNAISLSTDQHGATFVIQKSLLSDATDMDTANSDYSDFTQELSMDDTLNYTLNV